MEYCPLPWLTERLGQPVMAAAEALCGSTTPADCLPADAYVLTVRWPSSRFMTRLPAEVPGAACYATLAADARLRNRIAWEEWVDLFLSEVVEKPRLTVADIQALGPDRDLLATWLLRVWGWLTEEDWSRFLEVAAIPIQIRCPDLPSPGMQDALTFMAKRYKRLPSEFLDLPFPAFVFNYRLTLAETRKRPSSSDAQGEAMLDAIGVEE